MPGLKGRTGTHMLTLGTAAVMTPKGDFEQDVRYHPQPGEVAEWLKAAPC